MTKAIGIDVGGTNLRVGVFDGHLLLQETRFKADFSYICKSNVPAAAWQKIIAITADCIRNVLSQFPDVQYVGIGFPGFIDPTSHTIAQSPNLPGLKEVNLAQELATILQKNVIVENDALAAAYGEYYLADKPSGGLIYLGLGTGLGGGLIHGGVPFAGQHGVAMEVGHIIVDPGGRLCGCGNRGCVEQYASASGVSMSYFERTAKKASAYEIASLADADDADARLAYEVAAVRLAQMLATVVKVLDISQVVIGGGMCHAWHLMRASFEARLDADLIPVLRHQLHIKPSQTGDIAGMLGASLLARHS